MVSEMRVDSFFRNQDGFTVAEVVASVGILMIGAMGIFVAVQSSFSVAATSRRITVATNYAHARLEEIKSTDFVNITTTYPPNNTSPSIANSLPNGQWYRIYPDGTSIDPLRIQVVVTWLEGTKTRSISLETLVSSK